MKVISITIVLFLAISCNHSERDNVFEKRTFKCNNKIDSVKYYKDKMLYLTEFSDGSIIETANFNDTILNTIDTPIVSVCKIDKCLKKITIDFNSMHYSFWQITILNKNRIQDFMRDKLHNKVSFIVNDSCKESPIIELKKNSNFENIILSY